MILRFLRLHVEVAVIVLINHGSVTIVTHFSLFILGLHVAFERSCFCHLCDGAGPGKTRPDSGGSWPVYWGTSCWAY